MTNREKAQRIMDAWLKNPCNGMLDSIEAELNRLDLPQPKKWEPRGGERYLNAFNKIKDGRPTGPCRLAGREYPTQEEAEIAAPLHRKLDRLVNWLVEHCPSDELGIDIDTSFFGNLVVVFTGTKEVGVLLSEAINSGEVEL